MISAPCAAADAGYRWKLSLPGFINDHYKDKVNIVDISNLLPELTQISID
jgi:hypothetical protein